MDDAEIIRVWNEIKASGSLNFKFREQATAYELAPFIAANMLTYPPNHIISAGYLLDDIDISLFRKYVSKLQPESAVITLRSRTYSWLPDDTPNDASQPDENTPVGQGANRKEPWYGVPYHSEVPSSDIFKTWESHRAGTASPKAVKLSLPGPNPFICYDLAEATLTAPTEVIGTTGKRDRLLRSANPVPITRDHSAVPSSKGDVVWHSRDEVFSQPRSIFQCLLHTANCGAY